MCFNGLQGEAQVDEVGHRQRDESLYFKYHYLYYNSQQKKNKLKKLY